jgi:protein O-mannosyl-transferase
MAKNKKEPIQKSTIEQKVVVTPIEYPISDNFIKNNLWKIILFAVVGFFIYFKTLNYAYVLDDTIVITDNNFTKKGFSGIGDIFTTESMTGYFAEQKNLVQGNRYRPLSLVTFAIENGLIMALNPDSTVLKNDEVSGDSMNEGQQKLGLKGEIKSTSLRPGISHFINILLYIASCIIIMRVLQLLLPQKDKIFGYFDFGFLAGLIYLVHPLHVEAVANIKGRDEIMAMLFSMLSLYYFVKHYLYGKPNYTKYLGLLCFMLGLLSKENTITFLAIIPLSIYFFGGKLSGKTWNSFFWLLLISFMYLVFRFNVAGVPKFSEKIMDIMNNPFLEMNIGEKIATIIYTLGLYIKLLVLPYPLTHDYYPYAIPIMNFGKWQVLLSTALYGTLAYFGIKSLKTKSVGGYSILFYLITLTIVSNFVINIGTFMNDRFIYMPSLGFCILLVWAIFHFSKKFTILSSDTAKGLLVMVPILLYALLSFIRVPDWKNALTLNKSSLKVSQNSARANSFMSTALFEEYKVTQDQTKKLQLLEKAQPYAKKAIEIIPNYYNANLMAVGIAGELHKIDGNLDKLFSIFEPCILNRPNIQFTIDYLKYINGTSADKTKLINFYINIGQKLLAKNTTEGTQWAITYMKLGLEIDPNNPTLNQLINSGFTKLGDINQARQYIK